jgi:hypothetical protein
MQIEEIIPGASGAWVLTQQLNGKWIAQMPMTFLEEFGSKEAAIANSKLKNPWLFTSA